MCALNLIMSLKMHVVLLVPYLYFDRRTIPEWGDPHTMALKRATLCKSLHTLFYSSDYSPANT